MCVVVVFYSILVEFDMAVDHLVKEF